MNPMKPLINNSNPKEEKKNSRNRKWDNLKILEKRRKHVNPQEGRNWFEQEEHHKEEEVRELKDKNQNFIRQS